MQKRISSTVIALSFCFSVTPSFAQEREGCFLRDGSGKSINLGNICGNNSLSPPPSNSTTPGTFRIPIKRREAGVPVIDVIFNGRQRYEMFFDTGASGIAITEKMAQELKIKPETKMIMSTANGKVIVDVGRVSSAQVGLVIQKDLAVIITPKLSIGLLGQNFFGEHDVTIKADEILFKSRN